MSENLEMTDLPKTHGDSVRKLAAAMLRYQIRIVLPVLVVAVIVFTVLYGTAGLLGAAIGLVVACLSSVFTLWLMRLSADHGPWAGMAAALGGFSGKMIILLIVFILLRDVTALHKESLAFTMLAGVLVAAGADIVAFRKTKIPTIIPS
jgi:hypothetical protein